MHSTTSQTATLEASPFPADDTSTPQQNWKTVYRIEDDPENSLEPSETTEISTRKNSYRDRLSLEFPAKTRAVEELYSTIDELKNKNYFLRLLNCRSMAIFQRHEETGKVKVSSEQCGLRWCPLCAKTRQGRIMNEATQWFKKVKQPKLMTLTMEHNNRPLKYQIEHLYKSFKKLRNRKLLKKNFVGGIWFFHIKISKNDGLWHVHLHCLIDSPYIEKSKIAALWSKITGGSYIVHMKSVVNPHNSVGHAARYAAEPTDMNDLDLDQRVEVFDALHGKRLCGTWGTGRTMNFRKPAVEDSSSWKYIGSWREVMDTMDTDYRAEQIFKAYVMDSELDEAITLVEPEPPPDGTPITNFVRSFFQKSFKFQY